MAHRVRLPIIFAVFALLLVTVHPAWASAAELPPGGTFVDDNGSTQEPYIEAIFLDGITKGCNPPDNDRFCPDRSLTRAEMATMLVRALRLPAADQDYFTDDNGSVHQSSINALSLAGITRGCNPPDNDRFCPDGVVTRGEMAAFLVRGFGYTDPGPGDVFTDDDASVFEGDIDRLATAGITRGCNPPSNTRYCPTAPLTRGEMAVFLTRALNLTPIEVPPPALQLDILPREDWGAQTADSSRMQEQTITQLTIHHAGDQTGTTGPSRYRAWQAYHISRGWGDLAYHYIVGVDGTIYEGRDPRYAGATGTNYDPSGHLLVVVEGNFDDDRPTPAQLDVLTRILAWATIEYGVSPSTIAGHRDHASTSCPGNNLYSYIASGEIETAVKELLAEAGS